MHRRGQCLPAAGFPLREEMPAVAARLQFAHRHLANGVQPIRPGGIQRVEQDRVRRDMYRRPRGCRQGPQHAEIHRNLELLALARVQARNGYGSAASEPLGVRVHCQRQRTHGRRTRVPKPNRACQFDDQRPSARFELAVRKVGCDDLQGQARGHFDRHSGLRRRGGGKNCHRRDAKQLEERAFHGA